MVLLATLAGCVDPRAAHARLWVVDARSGEPLPAAQVEPGLATQLRAPPLPPVLGDAEDAAVAAEPESWWWVAAPGYYGQYVRVDSEATGEIRVRLGAEEVVQDFSAEHALSGRIVVTDDDGAHVPRTGWIRIAIGMLMAPRVVRVVDGAWSLDFDPWVGVLAIKDMELDGRAAHCPEDRFVLLEGIENVIEARWTPQVSLVAVDARTGRSLDRLYVLAPDVLSSAATRPRKEVELRTAPVRISAWDGPEMQGVGWGFLKQRPHWVRAPGFDWKRVVVDHTVGGTVRVELVPEDR